MVIADLMMDGMAWHTSTLPVSQATDHTVLRAPISSLVDLTFEAMEVWAHDPQTGQPAWVPHDQYLLHG